MAEKGASKGKNDLEFDFIAISSMVFFDHLSSGVSLLSLYSLLFLNTSQKKGSFGPTSKIVLNLEQTLSDLSGLKEPTISRLFLFSIF